MTSFRLGSPLRAHVTVSAVPPGIPEEYFAGGRQGTVFNTTSRCLELPSPAVEADPKLARQFAEGEAFFDADFVVDPRAPFGGLGPVYVNNSCRNCHPNYGRSRRVERYNQQFGGGYTAYVHTPDGKLVDGYLFMLQTRATPPYKPLAKGVDIKWRKFVDEYGNTYPDGTPYNQGTPYEGTLIYPEADIIDPLLPLPDDYKVSIEGTIGLFGTGLLDAIPDQDIIAEYERQQVTPGPVKGRPGEWVTEEFDGKKHLGKFTWHNTRATLRNGPGANGIWNVPNITREDRPNLFASRQWIEKQAELGLDTSALTGRQPTEMTREDMEKLTVWFTGLAVPAARNLGDPMVQRGKKLFHEADCASCHKPSWVTGKSDVIPGYAKQKIWPYTDMLMHDMGKADCRSCHKPARVAGKSYTVPSREEIQPVTESLLRDRRERNHGIRTMNHGFRDTFRTPPLWARGLMKNVADHTDMWHDMRARNFEEAILWHHGEALGPREAFRNMPKEDRAALIEFLKSL
ncbi:thiol oxidoreductase [Termitidicoccus mucosus]|uniref:Thiol oxidoreductase n=1 Tax=Termitidicoccus mucosus TaxID=1184151 RepID=A0A178IMY0_9BACT|nr:thiol oxidoreductase [Opitutaceae bacterium TSB47]